MSQDIFITAVILITAVSGFTVGFICGRDVGSSLVKRPDHPLDEGNPLPPRPLGADHPGWPVMDPY